MKSLGQVFTPNYIVNNMLDLASYNGSKILNKHIMENSCGEGAFLVEIVKRYCEEFYKISNDKEELKKQLSKYIHGIEKDKNAFTQCIQNLNQVIEGVSWDIKNEDTLLIYKNYLNKMDYVIGNPPYVRIHNLDGNVKHFSFASRGMTDLYLVFYEIGLKMLNNIGKLCYITPSSFLKSGAGFSFREYIVKNKNLSALVDLEHFQPFKATAYTCISLFDNTKIDRNILYYKYNEDTKQPQFIDNIKIEDSYIDGKVFLATSSMLKFLRNIQEFKCSGDIKVKNGYATLADDIFIGEFTSQELTIPIIKASTGKIYRCIYPYTKEGKPLSRDEIKNSPIFGILESNKEILYARSIENPEKNWHLFGRSQGILDTYKNKIAINTTIKDINSIKINEAPEGCGVYGGLYILSSLDVSSIESIIKTEEFITYIKSLQNYKNGGYYSFSSKDLEKFLNFKVGCKCSK